MIPIFAHFAHGRRRLGQFSLRSLLIATTLVAVWLNLHMQSTRAQQAAVATILASKGESRYTNVYYSYQKDADGLTDDKAQPAVPAWLIAALGVDFFYDVHDVVWHSTPDHTLQNNDLACLGELPQLRSLTLSSWKISDCGMKHLAQLHELRDLYVGNTEVSDSGLIHLRGLDKLQSLYGSKYFDEEGCEDFQQNYQPQVYIDSEDRCSCGCIKGVDMKPLIE